MQKCIIKISNQQTDCNDYEQFDSIIENILLEKYSEDFLFDFDVWQRQSEIDYRVRSYPLNLQGWDTATKTMIAVWETPDQINPFVDYFFNHETFLKFKNALIEKGWEISDPKIEL